MGASLRKPELGRAEHGTRGVGETFLQSNTERLRQRTGKDLFKSPTRPYGRQSVGTYMRVYGHPNWILVADDPSSGEGVIVDPIRS